MKIIFIIACIGFVLFSPENSLSASTSDKPFENSGQSARQTAAGLARLSVHSNIPAVRVYLDTVFIGITPLENVMIEEGRHIARFVRPDDRSWYHDVIIETLMVSGSDSIHRMITFPTVYRFTSEPYGATGYYHDTLIGETPFHIRLTKSEGNIILSKDGFESFIVPIVETTTHISSTMQPLKGINLDLTNSYLAYQKEESNFPVYVTLSATIATGIASAYFKTRADQYYTDYRQTNDQANLNNVRTFDAVSGILMVSCEVSLFVLSYLLLTR